MSTERYEYRFRFLYENRRRETPWQERPITAEELAEWEEDFPTGEITAERRAILYGEPERFQP